jgi:hypothetical protein
MTETNVFNQRICDKRCPAWSDKYHICDVGLDYQGRILPVHGVKAFGRLCKLPIEYELIHVEDEA